MIYENIKRGMEKGVKQIALLIDPDKTDLHSILTLSGLINDYPPDLLLVGGSLISENVDKVIETLKERVDIPVFLFPGSSMQVNKKADGILFLSLISGRNPEFLISHQVSAAPLIRASRMEVISTGYILIEGGTVSSVEYMSNTRPVPADKSDLALATALAGEMMGMKAIYLEAGSGAVNPVPGEMIKKVKENINIPLIVGGGLNTERKVKEALDAGADMIVVGNAFEKNPQKLKDYLHIVRNSR